MIGRFINADELVSTSNIILGNNMFAYCNNNPMNFTDESGMFPVLAVVGIVVGCLAIIGTDHYIAKNYPDGYALVKEDNGNGVSERWMYAEGNGFELDQNGITLCDTEIGLVDATYKNKNIEAGFFDCFTAAATAELDWSGVAPAVDVSAVASIYTADFEFKTSLFGLEFTFSGALHVGAVGAGIELDPESGKLGFTPPGAGVIPSLGFDIDLAS